MCPPGHLDLKAVTRGLGVLIWQTGQSRSPEGPEAGGCVLNRCAEHHSCVEIPGSGDETPMNRPIRGRAAGHITGANRQVRPFFDRRDQSGQIGRIVPEVGVHLDDNLRVAFEKVVEGSGIGGAESFLCLAMHDRYPVVIPAESVGNATGAVGGGVIDYENVVSEVGDGSGQVGKVLALVVGGYDDRDPLRRHGPGSSLGSAHDGPPLTVALDCDGSSEVGSARADDTSQTEGAA